jgi:hypothetical protein
MAFSRQVSIRAADSRSHGIGATKMRRLAKARHRQVALSRRIALALPHPLAPHPAGLGSAKLAAKLATPERTRMDEHLRARRIELTR